MASGGWTSKQARKWMSLSVDETPGSFRRLDEDEARKDEWPAVTLPSSEINGKDKVKVSKQAVSASLPRPKSEGKPSLFTAFTWSKGKKSRPKLNKTEKSEDDSLHQNDDGLKSDATDPKPGNGLQKSADNNLEYSERAVDVGDVEKASDKKTAHRLCSSSSSSSMSSKSSSSKKQRPADRKESTSQRDEDMKPEEQQIPSVSDQTPAKARTEQSEGHAEKEEITTDDETKPKESNQETEREGETGRGETYFDTGRRFRLEATVMVDDERPAERRVTYLGPVLLSPLGQRHGQYVHVTVAPGSGMEASEGSSLMLRPAQPVLIHPKPDAAAKSANVGEDGAQTKGKANGRDEGEERPKKPSLSSSSSSSSSSHGAETDKTFSPGNAEAQGPVSSAKRSDSKAEDEVMDLVQSSNIAALGAASPEHEQKIQACQDFPHTGDDQYKRSYDENDTQGDGDAVRVRETLRMGPGTEKLTVMREMNETYTESAPSPIPFDQSVFGTSSSPQSPALQLDKMAFPVPRDDTKGRVPLSAPVPPQRRHRRTNSSSSSTSSLSSSSTSSNNSKSKQKSHDFKEENDEFDGDSRFKRTPEKEYEILKTAKAEELATCPQSEKTTLVEESKSADAEDKPGGTESFGRPRIELLDPHVLLAGDAGEQKAPRGVSPAGTSEQKTLEENRDKHPVEEVKEEPVMRQSAGRPQKPARTSLVKEDTGGESTAPSNADVDRPPLPLKRTPRTSSSSSSSSSSDNEDQIDERKQLSAFNQETSSRPHSGTPKVVLTRTDDNDESVQQHCRDDKISGSDSEKYETANDSQEDKHAQMNSSSANSSLFVTDTSLTEQIDLPHFEEMEIRIASQTKAEVPLNIVTDTTLHTESGLQPHQLSPVSCHKDHSDSEKSTSSSQSWKKDTRKPPVFVTPPPPPTKPVRTCGSQSDLSDRSDMEYDTGRTPPKPARFMDRLSPNLSLSSDRDDHNVSYSMNLTSSPFPSEAESKPPVLPPRGDKPKANSTSRSSPNEPPASRSPSARISLTSSDDDDRPHSRSKQGGSDLPTTANITEQKVSELNLPAMSVQVLQKTPDNLETSSFVPYEDSEIYYKDIVLSPNDSAQDLNSSQTSSSSAESKKGKLAKGTGSKLDKSSSSNEAKNAESKTAEDPPPVPPRQKMSGKKNAAKATSDLNTSTSSSTSQGSRSSHDRPSQPPVHARLQPPSKITLNVTSEDSEILPQYSDSPRPDISVTESFYQPDMPSLSLQHDPISDAHNKSNGSFELELSLQQETAFSETQSPRPFESLGTPCTEVKLPIKPVRTPSPRYSSRTPSPKVVTARTPSPSVSASRTPSPKAVSEPRKKGFRPISAHAPYDVKMDSRLHTDDDTSEAEVNSSVYRSVSMSSTTSATSQEGEKEKKSSTSKLRKYWPFRRKKGDKKGKNRKEKSKEEEMSASSPHLSTSLPLHQSTPTLERYASDPNTARISTPQKSDKVTKSKCPDTDTSTLSESATEKDNENKTKKKRKEGTRESQSSSGDSSKQGTDKKKKSNGEDVKKPEAKEEASSDNRSTESSKNVTHLPETGSEVKQKTEQVKATKRGQDKSKEHDTSTSSSSSSTKGNTNIKPANDKEDKEEKGFAELALSPPRVATPLREQVPSFYSHPPQMEVQQHRFDGEFQRLDEDIQADADVATALVERRPPMVVVAVDLGTTHSGYAFSFSRDPGSVYVMSRWAGQEPGLLNHKTLSALLLTPDARFHSFGLAARNHYHNLLPIEARHWLYFERFKMTLHHCKELSRDTMVTAVNGKQLPALTVFAHVLDFFATHALQQLGDQSGTEFRRQDVRWVVTVPAIWREPAKQLMRQAALAGGMFTKADPSQLLIVLEPEAASIYCRRLRMHQLVPEVGTARPLQSPRRSMELTSNVPAVSNLTIGTRYVVVDCGGGTVDITVHELNANGQLVELHRATGGPHGSTGVDAEFEALLRAIFSNDFIDTYTRQFPVGWVNLMTDFESRKRAASPFKTTSFNVSLPFTFISEFRKHKGEVDQAVKRHADPDVEWSLQGMLRLAPAAMRRLFAPTLVSIRQAIGDVLNHPNTRELRYLFLVGGFAESPLLQHEVRREFGHLLTVLIPQDVSLAVLRGAVLFGLDPKVVSVRCARLTYGVGILNRFDSTRHPPQKRVHRDGVDWCTDVFDRFVGINQPVSLGTSVTRRYTPARSGQLLIVLNIYSSVNPAPSFITDPGVRKCGTLYLDLRQNQNESVEVDDGEVGVGTDSQEPREILARMAFGDTEIRVIALDVKSGKEVKASVDFLSG